MLSLFEAATIARVSACSLIRWGKSPAESSPCFSDELKDGLAAQYTRSALENNRERNSMSI